MNKYKNKNNIYKYYSNIYIIILQKWYEKPKLITLNSYFYDIWLELYNFWKFIKLNMNLYIPNW